MTIKELQDLAFKAPITFEMACSAWGDTPDFSHDKVRETFFAVWALLNFEWAEAMMNEAERRNQTL